MRIPGSFPAASKFSYADATFGGLIKDLLFVLHRSVVVLLSGAFPI
jgi:hypothetical protein